MQTLYLFKKWLTKKKAFFVCIFCFKKLFFLSTIFCFKKLFFCQPFFEKIQGFVVSLPSKSFFFLSTIFCQLSTFPSLFEEKEGFPTFSKGLPRETHFSGGFPKVFRRKTCVPSKTLGQVPKTCVPSFSPLFEEKG